MVRGRSSVQSRSLAPESEFQTKDRLFGWELTKDWVLYAMGILAVASVMFIAWSIWFQPTTGVSGIAIRSLNSWPLDVLGLFLTGFVGLYTRIYLLTVVLPACFLFTRRKFFN